MTIAPAAGLGLKPQHCAEAISDPTAGVWFEIHPENYMCDIDDPVTRLQA